MSFSKGQMVKCISNHQDPHLVGCIGQVNGTQPIPFDFRRHYAMKHGKDVGDTIYEVKFVGHEPFRCSPGCREAHYPLCFHFEIAPIDDPDLDKVTEEDEELEEVRG